MLGDMTSLILDKIQLTGFVNPTRMQFQNLFE